MRILGIVILVVLTCCFRPSGAKTHDRQNSFDFNVRNYPDSISLFELLKDIEHNDLNSFNDAIISDSAMKAFKLSSVHDTVFLKVESGWNDIINYSPDYYAAWNKDKFTRWLN